MNTQELAENLIITRRRRGHSQQAAADEIECALRTLQAWEAERSYPQRRHWKPLRAYLASAPLEPSVTPAEVTP